MARLTATLLFAALASAEYTTSVWLSKIANSDKYGYVASVIDADAQHVTMSMSYDVNTDNDVLGLGDVDGNFTFGPSSFVFNQEFTRFLPTPTDDSSIRVACTQPAQPNHSVECEQAHGDAYARFIWCNSQVTETRFTPQNVTTTYPHTYGTGLWGPSGVETITLTLDWPATRPTTTPEWCTSDDVPATVLSMPYTQEANMFAYFQVIITAGEEKLSAYSSSSLALSTASRSTGQVPSATRSAESSGSAAASGTTSIPESTGAAERINSVAPILAGMGIAAVMGML